MASILAIISKQAFGKLAPRAQVGDVLAIDSYASTKDTLELLRDGGTLFLVTVRPPEQLWLVAILEEPFFEAGAWRAQLNAAPITDVTDRIDELVFENGAGLAVREGALAMALQAPRVLLESDVAVLRGTAPPPPTADAMELQLLDMVAANLDDDAPRMVLADWYLDRGDPRGELIHLALRDGGVSGHEEALLGDLFAVTASRTWSRGLPVTLQLAREDAAPAEVWARAVQHPWLRVVQSIERGKAKPARYAAFVTSPHATSLESVAIANPSLFARFIARPRLSLRHLVVDGGAEAIRVQLVADAALFPGLTQITLRGTASDFADIAQRWSGFARNDVEIMLRAQIHHDQRDNASRAVVVDWLRAASPTAAAERVLSNRLHTVFRTRRLHDGLLLEVATNDLSADEVLVIQSLLPLARLVVRSHGEVTVDDRVREILDVENTLGTEVRRLFARLPYARVELHDGYEPLQELCRGVDDDRARAAATDNDAR